MLRKPFVGVFVLIMIFALVGCNSSSITGRYERIKDQKHVFIFENTQKGEGTYEEYFDGEKQTEEYIRNEWKITDNLLILNDGEERFKIYKDCIIRLEKDSNEPKDYDLVAPKGNNFDFETSYYKFNADGTFDVKGNTLSSLKKGEYYRKGNIIYLNLPWNEDEDRFIPYYYIYDNDHIIDAQYVYIK